MYTHSNQPNTRIDVADVLRGFAILGILLVHSIEQYNMYHFPETDSVWLQFLNQAAFQGVFQFLLGGKMYAIFALLFGLSFFIQIDNQAQKGRDFRPRFLWRLFLLLCFGLLNSIFYNGDILALYAVCGMLLLPLAKCSSRTLAWLAVLLALQPVEWINAIHGICDPTWTLPASLADPLFGNAGPAMANGTLGELIRYNLTDGIAASHIWSVEHGRVTQTLALFLLGIMIGRNRLFYNERNNLVIWNNILVTSTACFFIFSGLRNVAPGYFTSAAVKASLGSIFQMWTNLAFAFLIIASLVLLFYHNAGAHRFLMRMAPYGKTSLTHYISQGIIGSFLFFGWGLGLYRYCGPFYSLLLGLGVFALQYTFITWWLKHHAQGPLEGIWKRLTWIHS